VDPEVVRKTPSESAGRWTTVHGPPDRLAGMNRTSTRLLVAAAASASLAVAAPAAGAATLHGETDGGTSITLKRSGAQVSKIKTAVPTICTETTGSGQTRAGVELFRPPGSFAIGGAQKSKSLEPAAMNHGTEATMNFTVNVKNAGGQAVRGKLSVNYSFLIPDLFRSMPYIYLCQGTAKFTAR
jgi:hypothetical protein